VVYKVTIGRELGQKINWELDQFLLADIILRTADEEGIATLPGRGYKKILYRYYN
jgi:hypothetical protein